MDIRRLEIFLKILETRSLSKTATALGLTQPSVSTSLKTLEDAIGHKLFERTPRAVNPLPQASVLEPYARTIVETIDEAAWALREARGETKTSLVCGASSVPALAIMPKILAEFNRRFPHVVLKFRTGESSRIIKCVSDGEFDVAVVGLRNVAPELSSSCIARDQIALLASKELLKKMGSTPKNLDDLAAWPLIMRETGSGTRAAFMNIFNKCPGLSARLQVVAEAQGLLSAISLARTGIGATPISSLMAKVKGILEDQVIIPLDFLGVSRNFYLIKAKKTSLSPAGKELIKIIRNSARA